MIRQTVKILIGIALVMIARTEAFAACGTLEVAKGNIQIQSAAGKVSAGQVGAKICSGDTITAAIDSRAKIRMEDGNELNISPDSKIVLENYQFNPEENRKKVLLNVLKGKVRAATKQENMYNDKAKDGQANSFRVMTKTAVAGVRGTDFLTSFDPSTNRSQIVTFKGRVEVGQPGPGGQILNAVLVGAGQKSEIASGAPPSPPKPIPPSEFDQLKTDSSADSNSSAKNTQPSAGDANSVADSAQGDQEQDGKASGNGDSAAPPSTATNAPNEGAKEGLSTTEKQDSPSAPGESKQAGDGSRQQAAMPNDSGPKDSGPKDSEINKRQERQAGEPTARESTGDRSQGTNQQGLAGQPSAPPNDRQSGGASDRGRSAPDSAANRDRSPASRTPSMLDAKDLAGAAAGSQLPSANAAGISIPVVVPPATPNLPKAPACDFCDRVLQGGPSRVNLRIKLE